MAIIGRFHNQIMSRAKRDYQVYFQKISTKMNPIGGYDISRFVGQVSTEMICSICQKVAKQPTECISCGLLYCQECIGAFAQQSNTCTSKCPTQAQQFQNIKGALLRMYNNLDIKCNREKCDKIVKISDLVGHEATCFKVLCKNADVCAGEVSKTDFLKSQMVCSTACLLTLQIYDKDPKIQREEILKFLNLMKQQQAPQSAKVIGNGSNGVVFRWDPAKAGTGIALADNNSKVFLKESAYMFRTIMSDIPMMSGVHYWEIHADPRTENELKIGVCNNDKINFNTAFCDTPYGWAYYGLAQLRHNSNASGAAFGKRFKKEGILGVCLDMNKGTLSVALNGESMGVAFQSPGLTQAPMFAAVALLHCAGCQLVTGKPVPAYFN